MVLFKQPSKKQSSIEIIGPGPTCLNVNGYDALTPLLQAYWEPVTTGNRITSYQRRQIDWTINTNRIIAYSVANTSFIEDEIVNIFFNEGTTGQGQVLCVNSASNTVYVQHVNGYYTEVSSYIQDANQNYIMTESNNFILAEGDYSDFIFMEPKVL